MSKVQTLRVFVTQRLTAAAEEIFELFERTIAEYEEEVCRQAKLLDVVFKPQINGADDQQLWLSKEEDPTEQQDWSPGPDQEEPPKLPHIKEEHEELWSSQEEAEVIKLTFTPVKSEDDDDDDEEEPPVSQLRQTEERKTKADCGGPEPARTSEHPDSQVDFHEPETDESCDWEETSEAQSAVSPLEHNEAPGDDLDSNTGTWFGSAEGSSGSDQKAQTDDGIPAGAKAFSCSICGKKYDWLKSLMTHMRLHSEGKRFTCSFCKKSFQWKADVVRHMRIHTGEKPFSCSLCGRRFTRNETLRRHMRTHEGEEPLTASVCGVRFAHRTTLAAHLNVHAEEKPPT